MMIRKINVALMILFIMFISFNVVCAGNFSDLNQQINDADQVILNGDIILNQYTSDEENTYKEGILIENREISIEGGGHAICGRDSDSNAVRVFNIKNSNVTLSNMLITSASCSGSGGAISLDRYSSLVLRNVTFRDNSALGIYGEGGAIYAEGFLSIYDSVFEDNHASGTGGAVFAEVSLCNASSSRFTNNSANWYGGAVSSGASFIADSCIFDSNEAYSGAAFHYALCAFSRDYAGSSLSRSNFTNNKAYFGGAFSSSTFKMIANTGCSFISNQATKGGVFYKSGRNNVYFDGCLIEDNSAETGGIVYDAAVLEFEPGFYSVTSMDDCILSDNVASIMSSIIYGKSANLYINNSRLYNQVNKPIYNGIGNITVMNSYISPYCPDFITQFLAGNVTFINNTCEGGSPDFEGAFNLSADSNLIIGDAYNIIGTAAASDSVGNNYSDELTGDECCSVYVRINQTDFAMSHRRDGGINLTDILEKDDDYFRQFKPCSEYFFLSKVYTNGWVIGTGGWDDSCENEKVEAIASDMVKNQKITMEALEAIFEIKKSVTVGHLLIVAPDGTYGNVITYKGNDFLKMGVLGDGDYIISPNSPDYRREGHLDGIEDIVESNINLSARDWYGSERHCILVHHVNINEAGFSDSIYVSNEDGSFVDDPDNKDYIDYFWFKEEFTPNYEIPSVLDYMYLGTFWDLNRTIVSHNVTRGYNTDYVFRAKFLNRDGDALANRTVDVSVNGKNARYVTDDEGIIEIPFTKLTSTQSILLRNPATGEVVKNIIDVVPRLIGEDVVMDYAGRSRYIVKVYDESGNPAGENQVVSVRLNGKTYEIKTDSNGLARFDIPNDLMPGKYVLEAEYAGQTIRNTVEVRPSGEPDENDASHRQSGQAYRPELKTGLGSDFNKGRFSFTVKNVVVKIASADVINDLMKILYRHLFDLFYLCFISTVMNSNIFEFDFFGFLVFIYSFVF